jgi:hypothetical protein
MAKDIGINQEVTLTSLTSFDYEKEHLRGMWWCLFLMDRFLFEKNCNLIEDKDNQIYMPGYDKSPFYQTQDKLPVFGLQVMSSTEWFTPGLPNQSLDAYRVLLVRIFGRALKFNYLTKFQPNSSTVENPLFIMASIEGSLREWWLSLPDYVISHLALAQSDQHIPDPEYTWRVVYTCVQYNHIRALVFHPCLLKNTLESPIESAKSRAFINSINIAHENAKVLSTYLRRNTKFEYCTATIGSYIFHTAFPLVLASRMNLSEPELAQVKESLEIHVQCLRENTIQYEVTPILIETLDYLISLQDPVDIIAQFSRFQAMSGKAPTNLKILDEPPTKSSPSQHYSSPATGWSEASNAKIVQNPNLNPQLALSNPLTSSSTLASSVNGMTHPMANGMSLLPNDKLMWESSVMDPMQMNLTPTYIDMLLSSDPFFQNQ